MSRYANQATKTAVVASTLETIGSKEGQYKESIKTNNALCVASAERLTKGGDLEETLLSLSKGDDPIIDEQRVISFLNEQRERLKKLSIRNINSERKVDHFVSAVRKVKANLINDNENNENENDDEEIDFEEQIVETIAQEAAEQSSMNLDVEEEEYYIKVCEALGESVGKKKNNKKGKKKGGDADEEDIEVIGNNGTAQGGQSLKCPVTGLTLEEPQKNKVCGHVYSLAGIMDLISRGGGDCQCPIAGCTNRSVSKSQLENDIGVAMRVRREKRNQDREAERIASQAANLEDSDDEEQE